MSKNQLSPQHSALSPVLIIAPAPPPYGGMALQAKTLSGCLGSEGIRVKIVATNPRLPKVFERVKGLRTVIQTAIFLARIWKNLFQVGVVHILGASYLYFFLRVVPAIILGRLFGRRVILNYRGGEGPRFLSAWGWAVRPFLRLVHVIIVPSSFLERAFSERGFCAQIIPNFVDLDRFRFRKRLKLSPHLLVTRNLEPMYNVKMALQAFEEIKRLHPDATLDIVGSGEQDAELKDWVRKRNLTNVFFHGAVPNEEIPSYLDRAGILLNTSYVDNMPINLLEAFAAGIPVVSTRTGGIPDLVGHDERAALLVKPGNYSEMARKIEVLLKDPNRVSELTTYAQGLSNEFTWNAVKRRWLGVYYPEENRSSMATDALKERM